MCVFSVPPLPLGVGFRKAVPQALGVSEEPRPEGGTIKSSGERVNPSTRPQPSGLLTIHQEINKKRFVSICPQKIQGFPLRLVWSAPEGPSEPQGGRARRGSCHGEPLIGPPATLSPSEPAVRQGCPRTPGPWRVSQRLPEGGERGSCALSLPCSLVRRGPTV